MYSKLGNPGEKKRRQRRLTGERIEAGRPPKLPGEKPPEKKPERKPKPAEFIDSWAYHRPKWEEWARVQLKGPMWEGFAEWLGRERVEEEPPENLRFYREIATELAAIEEGEMDETLSVEEVTERVNAVWSKLRPYDTKRAEWLTQQGQRILEWTEQRGTSKKPKTGGNPDMVEIVDYAHDWARIKYGDKFFDFSLKYDMHFDEPAWRKELHRIKEMPFEKVKQRYTLEPTEPEDIPKKGEFVVLPKEPYPYTREVENGKTWKYLSDEEGSELAKKAKYWIFLEDGELFANTIKYDNGVAIVRDVFVKWDKRNKVFEKPGPKLTEIHYPLHHIKEVHDPIDLFRRDCSWKEGLVIAAPFLVAVGLAVWGGRKKA